MQHISITCPHCRRAIDMTSALEDQLKSQFEASYKDKIAEADKKAKQAEKRALEAEKNASEGMDQVELMIARAREDERLKTRQATEERIRLETSNEVKERDLRIQSLNTQIEKLSQKSKSSISDHIGKAQEVLIKEVLDDLFQNDRLEEIPRGSRGADILQFINGARDQAMGSIYWESKNTQRWENKWIDEALEHRREKSAELVVIVSHTLPANINWIGEIKSVWVCSPEIFASISQLFRASILRINQVLRMRDTRMDSAELLHEYITGHEFGLHLQTVLNACEAIKQQQFKARSALDRYWSAETECLGSEPINFLQSV